MIGTAVGAVLGLFLVWAWFELAEKRRRSAPPELLRDEHGQPRRGPDNPSTGHVWACLCIPCKVAWSLPAGQAALVQWHLKEHGKA